MSSRNGKREKRGNARISICTNATKVCAFLAVGTCRISGLDASSVARLTIALQAFSLRCPALLTRSNDALPFSMSGPATPRRAEWGEARAPREARIETMTWEARSRLPAPESSCLKLSTSEAKAWKAGR